MQQDARAFTTLVSSRPEKESTAPSAVISALLHVALIALAVMLSSKVQEVAAADDGVVNLVPVHEEEPPPPAPTPQMPTPQLPSAAEVPQGFQMLDVPTIIPPDIPPPTAGPEINEADFSGRGVAGGRADGRRDLKVTPDDLDAAVEFTPFTVAPQLRNRAEVGKVLERTYPSLLRDSGIGGTVVLWVQVDEQGNVLQARVHESSSRDALDAAAVNVARTMRFTPALNRDVKVKVWIQIPVVFRAD